MSKSGEDFIWRMIDRVVPSASKSPHPYYNEYTSTFTNVKEEISKKSILEGLFEIVEEMKADEKNRNGWKIVEKEEDAPEKPFHFDIKDLDTE